MFAIKILGCAFLSCFASMLYAQKEMKSPEEVFRLYFETFVNEKPEALAELNEYLKPMQNGEDSYAFDGGLFNRVFISSVEAGFFEGMKKSVAEKCRPDYQRYMEAHLHNLKNATYKIDEIKTIADEWDKGRKIKVIYFTVFVKTSNVETKLDKPSEQITVEELRQSLKADTEELMKPNTEIPLEMVLELHPEVVGGKTYYYNASDDYIKSDLINLYFQIEDGF